MVKTQIQLPEELYKQLKLLSEQREWSMAEALRRGAEYVVRVYLVEGDKASWEPPESLDLGQIKVSAGDLRDLANIREPK